MNRKVPEAYLLTEAFLKPKGVKLDILSGDSCVFHCLKCGTSWAAIRRNGQLPYQFWRCPKQCNEKTGIRL